jgi:hypothetical protein
MAIRFDVLIAKQGCRQNVDKQSANSELVFAAVLANDDQAKRLSFGLELAYGIS